MGVWLCQKSRFHVQYHAFLQAFPLRRKLSKLWVTITYWNKIKKTKTPQRNIKMIVEGVMTELEQESYSKTSELLLWGFQEHKHVPVLIYVCTISCFPLLSLTLSFHFSSLFPISAFLPFSLLSLLSLGFHIQALMICGLPALHFIACSVRSRMEQMLCFSHQQIVELKCYNAAVFLSVTPFLGPAQCPFYYTEMLK